MDPTLFASFLAATFVIVATPGSTVALASTKAVRYGPGAALITVMGDALGTATQILMAVLGLQALIVLADQVLPILQLAGGAYIAVLGYRSFFQQSDESSVAEPEFAHRGHFWTGFLVCISNPKSIIFFIALFPSFISQSLNVPFQALVYGTVFVLLDALFIMSYAFLAMRAFRSVRGGAFSVAKVSGVGLMLVGGLLVYSGLTVFFSH